MNQENDTEVQHAEEETQPQEAIQFVTKIDAVLARFQFHDIIKSTDFSRHFIVQDYEADTSNPNSVVFFFLKQNIYDNEQEFRYALKYYQKVQGYCRKQLAKNDIIKINLIYSADIKEDNYYELILVMDIGEPDRIDIENIQSEHITKFLKTVCNLLEDIKNYDKLYHGNICLKNIVLVQGELKLSGFKPIFLFNQKYENWKTQLSRNYDHFRADLFMIGLIWLRFLGVKIEDVTQRCKNLVELKEYVKQIEESIPVDNRIPIITNLLNLDGLKDLSLGEVILQFEEYFVLEEIKNSRLKMDENETQNHKGNAFCFEGMSITDKNGSVFRRVKSITNQSDNLFNQQLKESEHDKFTLAHDGKDPTPSHTKQQDYLKIDGEFTLQDEDSVMMHDHRRDGENMIKMKVVDMNEMNPFVNSEKNLMALVEKNQKSDEVPTSLRNVKSANEVGIDKLHLGNDAFGKKVL